MPHIESPNGNLCTVIKTELGRVYYQEHGELKAVSEKLATWAPSPEEIARETEPMRQRQRANPTQDRERTSKDLIPRLNYRPKSKVLG